MDFYKLILFLFASIALVLGIKAASLESSTSMTDKNITVSENISESTDFQDHFIQKQLFEQRKRIFRLGVHLKMPYKNETVDPNEYLHLFNNIDTEKSRLEELKMNFNESMIGFSETLTNYRNTIDLAEQSAVQDLSLNETTNVTVLPKFADQSLKPVMLANSTINDMKEMEVILSRVHTHLNKCDNELNTDLSNVTLAKDLFSGANEMFSDTVVEFYQNFYSNITRNENEETKNYVMELINGLIVSLRDTLDLCQRIYQSDRLIKIPQYFNGTYGRFLIFDAVKRNFDDDQAELIEYDFNDEDKIADFETNSIDAKK